MEPPEDPRSLDAPTDQVIAENLKHALRGEAKQNVILGMLARILANQEGTHLEDVMEEITDEVAREQDALFAELKERMDKAAATAAKEGGGDE